MPYTRELAFLKDIFAKCRLPMILLEDLQTPNTQLDLGLRMVLGQDDSLSEEFYPLLRQAEHGRIYRMTDAFLCTYIYFKLPNPDHRTVVIGPYLSVELTHEQLLEQLENYGFAPSQFTLFEKYYGSLPIVRGDSSLYAMLDTFAERAWGENGFTVVDVNREFSFDPTSLPIKADMSRPEEAELHMQAMEHRYAYENELMQAVSQGQIHKAELLLAGMSQLSFERRFADPVRNMKNYCIIMNTLLRKAAERGGVHPVYLDRVSSDFAHRIETLSSTDAVMKLMEEIFHSYCRLVKKNSTAHYSPPVQKTVLYIDTNLSGDLSLKVLSQLQSINASYLSSLFKKETGQTITDYINNRRV